MSISASMQNRPRPHRDAEIDHNRLSSAGRYDQKFISLYFSKLSRFLGI